MDKSPPPPEPILIQGKDRIGRYRLASRLGSGGFGEVFLGIDEELARPAAVKILKTGAGLVPDALERFQREARLLASLRHPGICDVYETGVDDGVAFIAMRRVSGVSLAQEIRLRRDESSVESTMLVDIGSGDRDSTIVGSADPRTRAETIRPTIELIEKVARALHAAHEAGVIHRDVKPANILVDEHREPVLVDFGLARELESVDASLTQTGEVMGTPAYMAPEQLRAGGGPIDRRVDVWALGVTLYEALMLRRPFEGPSREAIFAAILGEDVPNPERYGVGLPTDLKIILATALEKDIFRRYVSAGAMADDLRAFLEGRPIAARPLSLAGRVRRFVRRDPKLSLAVGLLLLLFPLAAGLLTQHFQSRPALARAEQLRIREIQDGLIAEAITHWTAGRLEPAQAALSKARRLPGGSAESLGLLVWIHGNAGDAESVLRLLDEAADAGLDGLGILPELRARAVAMQGGHSGFAPLPLTTLRSATDHWLAAEVQAIVAPREALSHARRAILLSDSPRLHHFLTLAWAGGHSGDSVAVEEVRGAIEARWPNAAAAWNALGAAYHLMTQAKEARTCYDRALALDPDSTSVQLNLANLLVKESEAQVAIPIYERLLANNPGDAVLHRNLGMAREGMGDLARAVDAWTESIRLDPRDPKSHEFLLRVLWLLGRHQELEAAGARAATLHPGIAEFMEARGRAASALRKPEEAIAHFERALEIDPEFFPAVIQLTAALAQSGKAQAAAAMAERGVQLRPDSAEAHSNLGLVLRMLGQGERANSEFRAAIALDAKRWEPTVALTNDLAGQGRIAEAQALLDAYETAGGREPEAKLQGGFLATRVGQVSRAIRLYSEFLAARPDHFRALSNLGFALYDLHDLRAAIERFDQALANKPDFASAHYGRGQALRRVGRYRESIESLLRAEELGRSETNWNRPTARALEETRRLAAIADRLDGGEGEPESDVRPEMRLEWAEVRLARGDSRRAFELSRDAFAEDPDLRSLSDLFRGPLYRALLAAVSLPATDADAPAIRQLMLEWLEFEAQRIERIREAGDANAAARATSPYLDGSPFATLRSDATIATYEAEAQAAWRALWIKFQTASE